MVTGNISGDLEKQMGLDTDLFNLRRGTIRVSTRY